MQRLNGLGARIAALPVVPVLAVLVTLQLAQAAWFAFNTPHNGAIWYSGGDATEYWTEQWAVGHHFLPQTLVGWGLPVYYAWVPLVAGPTLLAGIKIIVAFQAIVLVPLALVLFWLVADRLFGRIYAWFAAALWVAGPLLLLHGFVHHYRPTFEQNFLAPHWFGLTNMGDFPSLVAVLACMWLTLRAFDTASPTDAALGGLLAGLAIGLKPANGYLLPAIVVLLVASWRPRLAATWVAGLVPAMLTLLVWKVRGLGYLPLTHHAAVHVAAGAFTPIVAAKPKYLVFDPRHFNNELAELREVFWSLRFLEFLVVAGAFGVIRKNAVRGLFVVVWFAEYGLIKGSTHQADISSTTWFRLTEPGLPAFILLTTGVAFCLPGIGRRVTQPVHAAVGAFNRRRVAIAGVLLGLIPLIVVGTASPASSQRMVRDNRSVNEAPLSASLTPTATTSGGQVVLSWTSQPSHGVLPSYRVYSSTAGDGCDKPSSGANECYLDMEPVQDLRGTTLRLPAPRQATWYRVAFLADYRRSFVGGDLMLLSPSVRVPGR